MKKTFVAATLAISAAVSGLGLGVSAHDDEGVDHARLESVLAAQPDDVKARYQYRHPKETIEFFGIEPGMTIADTLPGSYYANIFLPYLGDDGKMIGVQYSVEHRSIDFKDNPERLERHKGFPERFKTEAAEWRGEGKTDIDAFLFGQMPEDIKGTVDAFLLFRAMHHLNKYEAQAGTLTAALADIYAALKPGGTLGVVQHRAPEGSDDEWAQGFNGYVKQSRIIEAVTAVGFELEAVSEINANPKDQPVEGDYVWRLPPSLAGTQDNPELRAERQAIGESDRMTLRFRKPE